MSSKDKKARVTKQIGTHDGAFHCDEALACWMLHQTEEFSGATITRTRNPEVLSHMDIVVDVGAEYDASRHRYDHHQREFVTTFDDKHAVTKLSSAGLVYKHFGMEVLKAIVGDKVSEAGTMDRLYQLVYDNFIEEIDAIDNGVSCYPNDVAPKYKISTMLGSRVGRLNPSWNDSELKPDDQFQKAMAITGEEMQSIVKNYAFSFLPARSIVQAAVEDRLSQDESGQLIVLKTSCPWKEHLIDLEAETGAKITYVLYPDQGGSWRIQAVPVTPTSFESRKPLPEPWRGVRDDALSALTGVEGCIFVHASGFIGGAKTEEAAKKLAKMALAHA
jgi:uncharacterized UPF0160 family protein